MLLFVIIYVCVLISAFTFILVRYINNSNKLKYNQSADKIIQDDLLDYSIRNPYLKGKMNVPSSKRTMLALKIKSKGKKHTIVFDPATPIYFGRNKANQIRFFDNRISDRQGCIYLINNRLWLKNESQTVPIKVKSKSFNQKYLLPKKICQIQKGSKIKISNSILKIYTFVYDYNQK